MSEFERLTTMSEVFDGVTLKAFCESCGEDDCRAFCTNEGEETQCDIFQVQKAFDRLAQYEDIGSPEEFAELKNKTPITNADFIRQMSDEDLAEFLNATQKEEHRHIRETRSLVFEDVTNGWLGWLNEEAKPITLPLKEKQHE